MEVVDTETAKEFMHEMLTVVDIPELVAICGDVEQKSAWFRQTLDAAALPTLTQDDYHRVLGRIFGTRGKQRQVLAGYDIAAVRAWLSELLDGSGTPGDRVDAFAARLEGFPENLKADFASELLHFARPEQHWLWCRWMWDPRTKTGALPLVTSASFNFKGDTPGAVYMRVGRATADVHELGDSVGIDKIGETIFATDVFLSCVYVVYAYTVLKMRMTQEFNKVMPGLPEFSRRLLGVNQKRTSAAAPSEN